MKKKLGYFILTFLLNAQVSYAQGVAVDEPISECAVTDSTTMRIARVGVTPNYFFRPFPKSLRIGFAGSDGFNYILDMNSGETTKIPGPYDPVPLGEHIVSVPANMRFYRTADLEKEGVSAEPILEDDILGVYQSVGILKSTGVSSTYRMLVDDSSPSGSIKDFTVKGIGDKATVTASDTGVKTCSNDIELKLPMISKDAKRLAGYDMHSGTTKIWDRNPDGTCTEKLDLGFATGKVDFSFDGKNIAFQMESVPTVNFVDAPLHNANMKVYVYNLEEKKMTPITSPGGGNSYYPAWREDGTLIYTYFDENQSPAFVQANPSNGASIKSPMVLCDNPTDFQKFLALGMLFEKVCNQITSSSNPFQTVMYPLSQDPKQCQDLVKKYWNSENKNLSQNAAKVIRDIANSYGNTVADEALAAEIKLEQILSACPTKPLTKASPKTVGELLKAKPTDLTPERILATKCGVCHGDKMELFKDKSKLMATGFGKNILARIFSNDESERMPRGGSLSDEELLSLESWVKSSSK